MASLQSGPARPPNTEKASVEEQLKTVHWHLLRSDHLRSGVASRAGALLSTNALVVAGIALAFSLRNQKPDAVVIVAAMVALACVVVSAGSAALALVSVRNWPRQFDDHTTPPAFLYCYAEIGTISRTFEAFKDRVTTASPDELLEFALAELWRCARLHEYRYRKIRVAMFWLVAALLSFLAAAAASALR
jgi:hypothetical protein